MRRTERPAPPARGIGGLAGNRQHRAGFQRLGFGERRQDAGQALRQHGLAGARRTHQQQVVAAHGGDLQRAPRLQLAAHVAQVGAVMDAAIGGRARRRGQILRAAQPAADLGQGVGHAHVHFRHQRGLGGVRARHHHAAPARPRAQQRRQHAGNAAQRAAERQLAEEFAVVQLLARHLATGGEDAQRDRQVEAATVLG